MITELWHRPATIERNNFIHKSLSSWAYNVAVGCNHACRFCYVPEASTNRMATVLGKKGVKDTDAEWGEYVFPREWNTDAFLRSMIDAVATPPEDLNPDGNRAVMLCTTTDPYQTIRNEDPDKQRDLNSQMEILVRRALEYLAATDLNVRILTRSPLARRDFDLMKKFGKRLLFGMSLPTLNNQLAKVYEPKAPAPSQRLATLHAAKQAGLNVFVAMAPTYPECDAADLTATLTAVRDLNPVTIFHEPINIRAENVARIEEHAKSLDVKLKTEVFVSTESWRKYATDQLFEVERIANQLGIFSNVLHLWPDKALGSQASLAQFSHLGDGFGISTWLNHHWNKVSAWPK